MINHFDGGNTNSKEEEEVSSRSTHADANIITDHPGSVRIILDQRAEEVVVTLLHPHRGIIIII
jgi:hypothetical protein